MYLNPSEKARLHQLGAGGDLLAQVYLDHQSELDDINTGIKLYSMSQAFIPVAGDTDVVFVGGNLLRNQTVAETPVVGSGAGSIKYYAVLPGSAPNAYTVEHVVAGTSTSLSVEVDGNAITVNLATDGDGVATSTAAQVIAAVAAEATAKYMVVGVVQSSGVAQESDPVQLRGGKGEGASVTIAGVACDIKELSTGFLKLNVPALGTTAGRPVIMRFKCDKLVMSYVLPTDDATFVVTATAGAEGAGSANSIDIVCSVTDRNGVAISSARQVMIKTLAVTADKGDLAAATSAVGTVKKTVNPATGENVQWMETTAGGLFSFKVADDQVEDVLVVIEAEGCLPKTIKLSFA